MKSKSNGKDFCIFALPGLFCFVAVVIIPFVYGVYLTLTDWEGASGWRKMRSIVLPLLKPIISTMVILNAMAFWNDFLLPSLVLTDKELLTLPLSTYSFYGTYSADYGTIMVGLLLCVVPILILYVVLQKQIINGVVAGAVK